jgi:hypothetical protein
MGGPGLRPRARYALALIAVLVIQVVFIGTLASKFQPQPPPDVYFWGMWSVSGCVQNASYSVPLNYTVQFSHINGPDAYVVLGLYVNHGLRRVSTFFVPRGTWGMTASGSEPVNCATFRSATLTVINTVAA